MSLWGRVFAAVYDRFMASTERAGLRDRRRLLLAAASGRVIGIGAGTGANLELYPEGVERLVLTEPEEPMAERLEHKLTASARPAEVAGRLLFLEHVRSDSPRVARWQDRIQPIWLRLGHGCNCNRDTLATIEQAGFEVDQVTHGSLPKAAPFVRPLIVGAARN